jgi:uncharacterized protein
MNVLFNARHELRSGWKFLLYVFIYIFLLTLTAFSLAFIFDIAEVPDTDLIRLSQSVMVLAVPGILAMVFMARVIENKPLAVFGVTLHERWRNDLLLGLEIAVGMLAVMLAGSALFSQLEVKWTAAQTSPGSMVFTLFLLIVAAANEELVFRGYPMQILMRGIGIWPAILLMSVIFGVLHAENPNATALGTLNTMVAGVMLSVAYLRTRSLWLPFGIHVGWNVGLGMILGFPLSGLDIGSLWTSQTTGSEFVVGGSYGPEAGLLATIIFAGAALTARTVRSASISPKLRAALELWT